MDVEKHIEYWLTASEKDWASAQNLFQSKEFVYCLFLAHLCVEKLLKGLIVKRTS